MNSVFYCSELENSVLEINYVTNVTTVISETIASIRVSRLGCCQRRVSNTLRNTQCDPHFTTLPSPSYIWQVKWHLFGSRTLYSTAQGCYQPEVSQTCYTTHTVTHTLPPYHCLPTYDKSLDTYSRHELCIPPLGAVIKYLTHTRRLGPTPQHPTTSFLHMTTHKILIGVTNSVFHELCIPPLGAVVKFLEHISHIIWKSLLIVATP